MIQKIKNMFCRQNRIFIIAIAVYIVSIFYAIVVKRSYYADGADFLRTLINLRYHTVPLANDESVMRIGINFINQIPVIIALKVGVTNIDVLQFLFSLPLFIYELAGMVICLKISGRKNRNLVFFPIASFVFFGILSEIFAINQAFNAAWVYWILFFFIVREQEVNSRFEMVILVLDLLLLPFSHETVLPTGILLIMICIYEVLYRKNNFSVKIKGLVLCDLIFAVLFNLVYINTHQAVSKSSYFFVLFNSLNISNIVKSNLLITIIGLILGIIFTTKVIPRWMECFFVCGSISYIIINFLNENNSPVLEYSYRSFITIGTVGTIFLAYLWIILPQNMIRKIQIQSWYRLTAIVLILQSFWQIGNSFRWHRYLEQFDQQLFNNKGFIQDQLSQNAYAWDWTSPDLSLLEAESWDAIDTIVLPQSFYITLDENGLWIPFSQIDKQVFNFELLYQYIDQIP